MLEANGAVPAPPLFGSTFAVMSADDANAVVLEAYMKPPEVNAVGYAMVDQIGFADD
jgi:hypothetical protein